MKSLIGLIFFSTLSFIVLPYNRLSVESHNSSKYLRYRDQYVHNLKNPILKRYGEMPCRASKITLIQEKVGEEE